MQSKMIRLLMILHVIHIAQNDATSQDVTKCSTLILSLVDKQRVYHLAVGICKINTALLYVVAKFIKLPINTLFCHMPCYVASICAIRNLVASWVYKMYILERNITAFKCVLGLQKRSDTKLRDWTMKGNQRC